MKLSKSVAQSAGLMWSTSYGLSALSDLLAFFQKDELAIGMTKDREGFYLDGHPDAIKKLEATLFSGGHLHLKIIGEVKRSKDHQ